MKNSPESPEAIELEPLLPAKAAAKILNTDVGTLRNWRSLGRGPDFVKVGSRVKYQPSVLRAYVKRRTVKIAS